MAKLYTMVRKLTCLQQDSAYFTLQQNAWLLETHFLTTMAIGLSRLIP
jgi:hypothetical protein